MDIHLAAALWSLNLLESDDLPEIALAALEAGLDSRMTRILAGETSPVMSEVGPMFQEMLEELNISLPAPEEATTQALKFYAQEIVDSQVKPYIGAKKISCLSNISSDHEEISKFENWSFEYEEFRYLGPQDYYSEERCQIEYQRIEKEIKQEAQKILNTSMT